MYSGPHIKRDGLVFGYDTGRNPSSNFNSAANSRRFFKGQPSETFNIGDMTPSSPNTFFTSNSTAQSNLHGTVWDWSYYPNSNISSEGGMEWHPHIKGPGFKGAWLMKRRPGGNGESNFSGTAPGSITASSTHVVSVWCKTTQSSCFRIHLNVTLNGSSNWGYASSYHSGGGGWERLSVTLPGNSGITSINVIRCQAIGSSVTADAYFRHYQVEKSTQPTPYLLGGTRSSTQSLIDLTKTTNVDVSNVSFDSDGLPTFDGTDDYIQLPTSLVSNLSTSELTVEAIVYHTSWGAAGSSRPYVANWNSWIPTPPNQRGFILRTYTTSQYPSFWYCWGSSYTSLTASTQMNLNQYYHVVGVFKKDSYAKIYVNGVEAGSTTTGTGNNLVYDDSTGTRIGYGTINTGRMVGNLPVVKIYSRALSPQEVQQNFRAYKNRFGL